MKVDGNKDDMARLETIKSENRLFRLRERNTGFVTPVQLQLFSSYFPIKPFLQLEVEKLIE